MTSTPAVSSTLNALKAYIASQEKLLAHTIADIEELRRVRIKALNSGIHTIEEFRSLLPKTLDFEEYEPCLPSNIDWSIFNSSDPKPFLDFALNHSAKPSLLQQSTSLSELHKFVRRSRFKLLEPILGTNLSAHDQSRHHTIHSTKRRKLNSEQPGSSFHTKCGRHGIDMSETDILSRPANVARASKTAQSRLRKCYLTRVENEAEQVPRSLKEVGATDMQKSSSSDMDYTSDNSQTSNALTQIRLAPDKKAKVRPDTYKVPWSDDEQRHLEALLDEYGPKERNRWLKISRAMHGRRTPRQVASRVQKFFEKLREQGLEPDSHTYSVARIKEEA